MPRQRRPFGRSIGRAFEAFMPKYSALRCRRQCESRRCFQTARTRLPTVQARTRQARLQMHSRVDFDPRREYAMSGRLDMRHGSQSMRRWILAARLHCPAEGWMKLIARWFIIIVGLVSLDWILERGPSLSTSTNFQNDTVLLPFVPQQGT